MAIDRLACMQALSCTSNDGQHHPPKSTTFSSWVPSVHLVFALGALLTMSACTGIQPVDSTVQPRPLGRSLTSGSPPKKSDKPLPNNEMRSERPARPDVHGISSSEFSPPTGALTLGEALKTALLNNPELAAFSSRLRAAEARALQASLWPNPKLSVEMENFGGTGIYSGLDAAEITAKISQTFLTGGEIDKRSRVATLQRKLKAWSYEAKRLDVFTKVVKRYVDVLATQRKLAVAEKAFDLAQQFHQTVSQQVKAGAVSPIRETRASAEQSSARVDLRRAESALNKARIALAQVLGLTEPTFGEVVGKLKPTQPVPSLSKLNDFLGQNPAIARWKTVLAKHKAAVQLAEAEGIPDITVGVGIRHSRSIGDNAAIASLSIPLPIFDRNQGNIQAAQAELTAARQQRRATLVRLRTSLSQRYQALQAARQAVLGLAEKALPAARSAYQSIKTAYRNGKRGFLDVLIARRRLFDVKTRYINALAKYHRTVASTERLIARPLHGITTNQTADRDMSASGLKETRHASGK